MNVHEPCMANAPLAFTIDQAMEKLKQSLGGN